MQILLVILGCLPFLFGWILNWIMLSFPNFIMPSVFIGLCFLLLWGLIAYFMKSHIKSTKKVILLLNAAGAIDLLLLGIQQIVLGRYWSGFVGLFSQFFYIPFLGLGFPLTRWSSSVMGSYCVSFLLMLVISALGCLFVSDTTSRHS